VALNRENEATTSDDAAALRILQLHGGYEGGWRREREYDDSREKRISEIQSHREASHRNREAEKGMELRLYRIL
jgi:hypothetical protein